MKVYKRKFIARIVAAVMVVVLGVFALTACDIFSSNNGEGGGGSKKNTTEIEVYIDNSPLKYTVKYGEVADIGVLVKSGYMINNITDEEGTVYFDFTGKSTSVWQKSYPSEFYANFVPVNNLSYTYDTQWTSRVQADSLGWEKLDYGFQNDERKQFQSALKGNASRKVRLTVSYREQGEGSSGNLYFRVVVNGDDVAYLTSTEHTQLTYITTTQQIELDARQLINGFSLQWKGEKGMLVHFVKDVVVQVQFT